jgi:uncharacterized protein YcbK (DUF882 family)
MLPERIGNDDCGLARRWILNLGLASMLVRLNGMAEERFASTGIRWPGLSIISGYRSRADQARINPDAPDSLHTRCPSLAVDLRVGAVRGVEAPEVWQVLGSMWELLGGRWGGRFRDQDLNHFDLGVGTPRV